MKKSQALSFCRILATLSILICHIVKYYTFIPGHLQLGQFFNIGVPMFIIISGYLYGAKYRQNNQPVLNLQKYYISRYYRVALPSQLWAIIVFIVTLGGYAINTLMVILNLQGASWIIQNTNIPDGGPFLSHSWFVTIILICYAFVPFMGKNIHNINVSTLIIIYIVGFGLRLLNINIFYFLLFAAAFYISAKQIEVFKIKNVIVVGMLVLCFGVRLLGHRYMDGTKLYNDYVVIFTHQIAAVAIIILCAKIVRKYKSLSRVTDSGVGVFIEKHSYSIYLVHYSLIPLMYTKLTLPLATICFIVSTAALAVGLDFISGKVEKLLSKDYRRQSC